MTNMSIKHWADVCVRLMDRYVHELTSEGGLVNVASYRAQMESTVRSIVTEERDCIDTNAVCFSVLRQLLIDYGCPWPEGGHIPTFVPAWLQSLGAKEVPRGH